MLSVLVLMLTVQLDPALPDAGVVDAGTAVETATPSTPADAGVAATDGGEEVVISKATSLMSIVGQERENVVHVRLRLGFLTEWGNHPSSPLGLTLAARIGDEHWSGVIEAWGLLPESIGDITNTGSLSVFSFGGIGGVCHERPVLSGALMGCVLGRGGVMRFDPRNIPDLAGQWQPTVAAGARLGGEWPRNSFLAFYVTAHAFVPILKPYLRGENVGWTQNWVFGGAQVGFRMRLE